jgi:predicted ester cyclase
MPVRTTPFFENVSDILADYEYGRLLGCQGEGDAARSQFELVLSGKPLEVGPSGKKTRYSLEVCRH